MDTSLTDFDWQCQPAAAAWVENQQLKFVQADLFVADLQRRMLVDTGTRLVDWIDHFTVAELDEGVRNAGFSCQGNVWKHSRGLFPDVQVVDDSLPRLVIKVDSVADFLCAHRIDSDIEGRPFSKLRSAKVSQTAATETWVIERHGADRFAVNDPDDAQIAACLHHSEAFLRRRRWFDDDDGGFAQAERLISAAIDDLGADWACDLFFAAERRYWQSRNRAAQIQKSRQDKLGLGWANHDHHTYRSSRQYFARLIGLLELLGFNCRERFYGGKEAGWGAQVLEQPRAKIVIFADVDLSPIEVTGDFAHDGLDAWDKLGTVGLWCKLHGEAILGAGMHHLECQFDFDAAVKQLAAATVETMAPFTDFDYLKQAFTEGEVWPIAGNRIAQAIADGSITEAQGRQFRDSGGIGSHLEILQRDDGYKGFNQTGISEIIRETDPRRQ